MRTTRRQFLSLAGGVTAAGTIPIVTLRPLEATPAMLNDRDPQRRRRSPNSHRQGQARHSAAGRERQYGADDDQRREPDDTD